MLGLKGVSIMVQVFLNVFPHLYVFAILPQFLFFCCRRNYVIVQALSLAFFDQEWDRFRETTLSVQRLPSLFSWGDNRPHEKIGAKQALCVLFYAKAKGFFRMLGHLFGVHPLRSIGGCGTLANPCRSQSFLRTSPSWSSTNSGTLWVKKRALLIWYRWQRTISRKYAKIRRLKSRKTIPH